MFLWVLPEPGGFCTSPVACTVGATAFVPRAPEMSGSRLFLRLGVF